MQEKIIRIIILIGAVFGIAMLYLYSLQIDPIEIPISEVGEHEGELVIVEGTVIDVHRDNSFLNIVLCQENATVGAFLETRSSSGSMSSGSISPGDIIRVMGMVSSYNGGYSITINGWNSLEVLERWDQSILTLPMLAQEPWNYMDLNVNISCRIGTGIEMKEGYSRLSVEDQYLTDYYLTVFVYDRYIQCFPAGSHVFLNARLEYKQEGCTFRCIIDSPEHGIQEDRYGEFWS